MLQLACILQMVPGWKYTTKLRVLHTDTSDSGKQLWLDRLKLLRIECDVVAVDWDRSVVDPHQLDIVNGTDSELQEYYGQVKQHITNYSSGSHLIFMYFPTPPSNRNKYAQYWNNLTEMTDNLPPTILVHGITEVTSVTL